MAETPHPAHEAGQRAYEAYCEALGIRSMWATYEYQVARHAWAAVEAALASHPLAETTVAAIHGSHTHDGDVALPSHPLAATPVASHDGAAVRDKAGEVPCRHEWFQGRCIHCEIAAKEYRLTPPAPDAEVGHG